MSIFGYTFLQNHIYILDSPKQKAQINKLAAERFLNRNDEKNTLIFLTAAQELQLESYVAKAVPRGRTYTYNNPLSLSYPNSRSSFSVQGLTAVVTVAKRDDNECRLYQRHTVKEGVNYGSSPVVTFLYGLINTPTGKQYKIFHYSSVAYARPPEHQPFSLNQYRTLNSNAIGEDVWIGSLFD